VDLPVYAEDGWTAGLLVVSDRKAIRKSSLLVVPVALYVIVGNKVFVDCSSELYRQTKERCLFARDRDVRLFMLMLMENRRLVGGLAAVSWTLGALKSRRTYVHAHVSAKNDGLVSTRSKG
jgi:hypothetical protein